MQQQQRHRNLIGRIGLALREAQLDHVLSQRQVARLSGVSRPTVHKLATGGTVRADLAVRVAGALMVVDLFDEPETLVSSDGDTPVLDSVLAMFGVSANYRGAR
jgi:transcriptional regulator with XRE-family HTH domain